MKTLLILVAFCGILVAEDPPSGPAPKPLAVEDKLKVSQERLELVAADSAFKDVIRKLEESIRQHPEYKQALRRVDAASEKLAATFDALAKASKAEGCVLDQDVNWKCPQQEAPKK